MTELEIDQALQTAAGGFGELWDYAPAMGNALVRVLLEEGSDEGVYFLCEACRRIEIIPRWQQAALEAECFDVDGEKVWLLHDDVYCRVECLSITAFYSNEFLKL